MATTIGGVATALPPHHYSQRELIQAFRKHWGGRLDRFSVLEKLHAAAQVDGRYLALPIERYPFAKFGEANDCWIEAALKLSEEAVLGALEKSGVSIGDVGACFFVSVTGIASPSIEARLMNRLAFSRHMKRIPIFGLGCVAGAAGIARAADYVKAYPDEAALLISVELCSLTIQPDDLSPANLVSSGLFGDGAAAVVIGKGRGPEIVATQSTFYDNTERVMGWDISEKGFNIVLSREVPEVVVKNLGGDAERFLSAHGLAREDISKWIIHTGGPKVLEATQKALGLTRDDLAISWQCLRRTGNLSSASVLFVLEQVLSQEPPAPGTLGILAAMGPAFCSELVLLRW